VYFCLPFYYNFFIVITLDYHFIPAQSTNHKCTQSFYFPLLYKPAAQKVKMIMKNFLIKSSRLSAALFAIPVVL
jgi:hypothetical protein